MNTKSANPIIEFSIEGYSSMMVTALDSGYEFLTFGEYDRKIEKVCLLRHDVDADPCAAFAQEKLEAGLGVRSTFIFMNRSPIYNLYIRKTIV